MDAPSLRTQFPHPDQKTHRAATRIARANPTTLTKVVATAIPATAALLRLSADDVDAAMATAEEVEEGSRSEDRVGRLPVEEGEENLDNAVEVSIGAVSRHPGSFPTSKLETMVSNVADPFPPTLIAIAERGTAGISGIQTNQVVRMPVVFCATNWLLPRSP